MDERSKIIDAWAKAQVLCAVLDTEALRDEDLPKGRVPTAHRLALEIHDILDQLRSKK
jgi:hypothetical protein